MVFTPRFHFDHVAIREVLAKRQNSCNTECNAPLAALNNPTDALAFCSNTFVDSFQTCVNCLAGTGISSYDATYFTSLKNSLDSIATSCNSLGRPVDHTLSIPAIGAVNTGSATKTSGTGQPTNTNGAGGTTSGPSIGVIVGGVVGGVAIIVGIGLLIFFLRRRQNNRLPASGPGLVPGGATNDPNKPPVAPGMQLNSQGYYPVPQTTGTPPPQMQQYNNMGVPGGQTGQYNPNTQPWQPQGPASQYGNTQFGLTSSYTPSNYTAPAQHQYGQAQGGSINQNLGQAGFVGVGGAMHDNRASTYAPSTFSGNSNAPYQPMSPGPITVATSSNDSQRIPSPPISSAVPLIQQYPITESYTHDQAPATRPQLDSPPAYEGADLQPGVTNQASGPAPLSRQEVELISQRVASIMNASGQSTADAGHIGKLVGEQRKN